MNIFCWAGVHQWAQYTGITYHDGGGRTGWTWRWYAGQWCCRHQPLHITPAWAHLQGGLT